MPDTDASPRTRWIALIVVCLGQLMSVLDGTIVNVVLPRIGHDLHFTPSTLTWVLNGYLLAFGSLLLLAGRLGDLIGRRRVFLAGVTLFTLASIGCALASDQLVLVVARFVQGIGGAGATAGIMAIIAAEFPAPGERARAMSVYMFVISAAGSIGLIAGGAITVALDWHWIFAINVPIGIVTVLAGRRVIAENAGAGLDRDLDWAGSLAVTAGLVLGVYAIVTSAGHGWTSVHTLGLGAVSLALIAAFVAIEARHRNPIMPLRVFATRGLPSSNVVRGLLIAGVWTTFFLGVLYLERVRGYGVLQAGLAFLPQTVSLAVLSLGPTARLVTRFGPRVPLLAGLILSAAGLSLLARVGAGTPYVTGVLPAMVLIGAGAGLAFAPLLTIAMSAVAPADAGLASGVISTSLQVSAALGVAVIGTIAADHTRGLVRAGTAVRAATLDGLHLGFAVGAGAVVVALGLALAWLRDPRPQPRAAQTCEATSAGGLQPR